MPRCEVQRGRLGVAAAVQRDVRREGGGEVDAAPPMGPCLVHQPLQVLAEDRRRRLQVPNAIVLQVDRWLLLPGDEVGHDSLRDRLEDPEVAIDRPALHPERRRGLIELDALAPRLEQRQQLELTRGRLPPHRVPLPSDPPGHRAIGRQGPYRSWNPR